MTKNKHSHTHTHTHTHTPFCDIIKPFRDVALLKPLCDVTLLADKAPLSKEESS